MIAPHWNWAWRLLDQVIQVGQGGVTSNYLYDGPHIADPTREEPISKQPIQLSQGSRYTKRLREKKPHLIRRSKSLSTWANWARARRWGFAQTLLTSMRSSTSAGNNDDQWPQQVMQQHVFCTCILRYFQGLRETLKSLGASSPYSLHIDFQEIWGGADRPPDPHSSSLI